MQLSVAPRPAGALFDVVGLGLNSVDLLTVIAGPIRPNGKHPADRIVRLPGGQTATALSACVRLGWRSRYLGRFGDDDHGRFSKSQLAAGGVDVSASVTVSDATNQFAVIIVDRRNGERTIMWQRDPALAVPASEVTAETVTSGRVLLVDCAETEAAMAAVRMARHAGIPTVIDVERVRPNLEPLLEQVDVIIAAQAFPAALTGEAEIGRALRAVASRFRAQLVAVTLGEEGSLALVGGREIRTPGFGVKVVDTTGAGDAFRGGFVAAWLEAGAEAEADELLRFANAVAALNCRGLGAQAGLPGTDEVRRLLASTG